MNLRYVLWTACASVVALTTGGCGGRGYESAAVEGTVSYNKQPARGWTVSFQPVNPTTQNAPGSFGKTDEKGNYKLETIDGLSGAVVGEHTVTIAPPADAGVTTDAVHISQFNVPARYTDGSEKFTVEAGKINRADYAIPGR